MDAVVWRINDGVGAEEVREEAALFLLSGFISRIKVADEEPAGSAVAVDLLEAHAVKHEPHAAPGLVEIVRENHGGGLAVRAVLDAGTGRDGLNLELLREFLLSLSFCFRGSIGIEFSVDAKREALEHFRFHRRIRGTRLPDGAFLIGARHHLNHRAVRDVDVGRAVVIALHAGAVLILFARGICKVDHLADRAADDVLRELGFIFGPFGFHVARLRVLLANHETDGGPEVLHHRPELFGRGIDAQPPVSSFLHHLRADGERNNLGSGRRVRIRRLTGLLSLCVRAHHARTRRNLKAVVILNRRQIGRNFEIRTRVGGLVLNLVVIEVNAEEGAARKRGNRRSSGGEAERAHGHSCNGFQKNRVCLQTIPAKEPRRRLKVGKFYQSRGAPRRFGSAVVQIVTEHRAKSPVFQPVRASSRRCAQRRNRARSILPHRRQSSRLKARA